MTIEYFTGFEGCASDSDVVGFFDLLSSSTSVKYDATNGFNNGKCMKKFGTGHWATIYTSLTKTKTVGFHVKGVEISILPNSLYVYRSLFRIEFENNNFIYMSNTGNGIVFQNTAFEVISTLTGIILPLDLTHIELKVFSNSTTGTIQLKINGTLVYDGSGLNTYGDNIQAIRLHEGQPSDPYYDNIYIADDFQGEIYSVLKIPTSDGVTQFTPLSGTDNYAMILTSDGDTSYVESDTVGHQDLYEYENLAAGLTPAAISVVNNARKEGTGERLLQTRAKQDAVEYSVGDVLTMPLNYKHLKTVINTAPDGTAWSDTKFNGLQLGIKIVG